MNQHSNRDLSPTPLDRDLLERARTAATEASLGETDAITVHVRIEEAAPSAAVELRQRQREALVRFLRQAVQTHPAA